MAPIEEFDQGLPLPHADELNAVCNGRLTQSRTVWSIIWSCLFTIFLCTWGSLHPNISSTPGEPDSGWFTKHLWKPFRGVITYKLPLFIWALLVPEYILAWAIRQYLMAGVMGRTVPGWTRTHGFFLIMGGFQLFDRPYQLLQQGSFLVATADGLDHGKFVRILGIEDVDQHRLNTIIPFATEEELKDRGKSDWIAKMIVVLQTSWFIVQCIARRIEHLPLTELEIVTLAYAMINFFIYIFWWDKPRDVGFPIRVYADLTTEHREPAKRGVSVVSQILSYVLGAQDGYTLLSNESKVPMFWSGACLNDGDDRSIHAAVGPSILGMAFGAIHLIAWTYEFPSYVNMVLWRTSCIAMVAIPLFSTVTCIWWIAGSSNKLLEVISFFSLWLLVVFFWLYLVARVATMVVAFAALSSLPSEAFKVVDWTTFIPHI